MKQSLFQVSFYTFCLSLIATSAQGQITPDGTLPTNVEQQGKVAEITGGGQAGNNLFHSFKEFSVPTGNEAFFNNAASIENILSRVTGGSISSIDGLIRANGTANLFLINPAGIIFGNNARLNIGGSFLGSTAPGLLFDDGTEFRATDTSAPVLTINAPIGLNLRGATGDINSTGNLNSDRNLTLAASNLDLQGQLQAGGNLSLQALDTITITDSLNNPFITTAGSQLSLQGDRNINISALNHPNSGLFSGGDLVLRSNNPINGDAHYYSGGDFRLEKLDGTAGDLISFEDPIVRSQGDVSFESYQGASLHILAGGSVVINGDIQITGTDTTANSLQETITLSNGSKVNIGGSVEPTLDIRAGTNNLGIPGVVGTGITPQIAATPSGSNITIGGTITNSGGTVLLTNQYQPNTELASGAINAGAINTSNPVGNGGNVAIDSRSDINVPGEINTSSTASSQLTTVANLPTFPRVTVTSGKGGAIAFLAARNISTGNFNTASTVNFDLITEVDTIDEANNIFAIPQALGQAGSGGSINLRAGNNLNVGNLNSASAIAINSNSVALDNFSIIAALLELNTGNGGDINLNAGKNLTAGQINSNVVLSDRLSSKTETTPNFTLAVSQVNLRIPQAKIGSGGEIFLASGDRLNTGSLDSSVSLTNTVNNSSKIFANNPNVATAARPSRAISTVNVTYDAAEIGSGGAITLNSDRATIGDVNSSISVVSNNTSFAEARVDNSAAAQSSANNNLEFKVVGNRPGAIAFKIEDDLNIGNVNLAVATRATNDLDSVAFSDGDKGVAQSNADSPNLIIFDSQVNFALLRLDLNSPDVDNAEVTNELPTNAIELVGANRPSPLLNTCPVTKNNSANQPDNGINTSMGIIYPARGIISENGKIRLTANPVSGQSSRTSANLGGCR